MFGESESESPRVPSPWDSLMSNSTTGSPASRPVNSSSPLSQAAVPRLVPEADDGNVEYKLQLLNPSASRFARLVTQLKWRLLEGGGQAYYELGVADSGALVGLPRAELEQSLETLEMMAGEIGASVIVVKEIEVPAALVNLNAAEDDHRRVKKSDEFLIGSLGSEGSGGGTGTETEQSTTEAEDDDEFLYPHSGRNASSSSSVGVFTMDSDVDGAEAGTPLTPPQFAIDLEISSVFKPRPIRTRVQTPLDVSDRRRRGPKGKKEKYNHNHNESEESKALTRRKARDRRREERRKALTALAAASLSNPHGTAAIMKPSSTLPAKDADALVSGLESLHVSIDEYTNAVPTDESIPALTLEEPNDDDDVFHFPATPGPSTSRLHVPLPSSPLATPSETENAVLPSSEETRLIVEALVVRKMSIEEGYLDFGGFAIS